jgi:cytoskeletal protein CcmA (bactofilin family)
VVVSGEVNGDIEARTLLHLHKTARFMGNVKTRNLVIEEGASFNGHVDMGDSLAQARPGADKPDTSKGDTSMGAPKGDVHQTKKHEPKNA